MMSKILTRMYKMNIVLAKTCSLYAAAVDSSMSSSMIGYLILTSIDCQSEVVSWSPGLFS